MTTENYSSERISQQVASLLEKARNNPISESRLIELEEKLSLYKDQFIENGYRDEQMLKEEDLIEEEILNSSALVKTLPEFKEMLIQIAQSLNFSDEWVTDLLAHENAHANVAESSGHEWVGYAAVFIKDDYGNLIAIQPVHVTKPQLQWGLKELIRKNIEVTQAPEMYDNTLSDGDVISIEEDKKRLEKINYRKEEDKARIREIRKELGLPEDE